MFKIYSKHGYMIGTCESLELAKQRLDNWPQAEYVTYRGAVVLKKERLVA